MTATGNCGYKMAGGTVCGKPTNKTFPWGTSILWFFDEHLKAGAEQVAGRKFKDSLEPDWRTAFSGQVLKVSIHFSISGRRPNCSIPPREPARRGQIPINDRATPERVSICPRRPRRASRVLPDADSLYWASRHFYPLLSGLWGVPRSLGPPKQALSRS
jgi:hypothetical protein